MRAAGPSGAVGDWDGWVLYGSFRWKHPKHIAELCRRPFRGISPRPSKALCTRLQLTNPAQQLPCACALLFAAPMLVIGAGSGRGRSFAEGGRKETHAQTLLSRSCCATRTVIIT